MNDAGNVTWEPGYYEVLIREHHLDTFGHVNNAEYLALLEEARWDLIAQRGYGYAEIHKLGIGPVILEVTLKFMRELHLREKVRISMQVLDYKGKVGHLKQTIESSSGEVKAEAVFKFGLFDL